MPGAGDLRDRISFEQRGLVDDERLGPWAVEFTRWPQMTWLRGGETVMASRLQEKQPVVITVRDDAGTRQINSDWKAFNARNTDQTFAIRSVSPAKERGFLDILAEEGRADG